MRTHLSPSALRLPDAAEAERILRSCVHCGFCNATCPTYQQLGNELDGPRGRIYLIKTFLEEDKAGPATRAHLDRCLSCRNCETTCPSGVDYHRLLDIGREALDQQQSRPIKQRALRLGLRTLVPRAWLFTPLATGATRMRRWLPAALADHLPRRIAAAGHWPAPRHPRRMLALSGCVQPGLSPNTNAAAARLLDRLDISLEPAAGCCGAIDFHLDAQRQGLDRARRNIDAWWPAIERGVEAILVSASGCGAFVKEYGKLLARDPDYADKALRVSQLARDPVEVFGDAPLERLGQPHSPPRLAVHSPCTLTHAQRLGGALDALLKRLGFELSPVADGHLCCGSAGSYSITQPALSKRLRDERMRALEQGAPALIVTANIGCQTHLDSAGRTPVRHWLEVVDEAFAIPAPPQTPSPHSLSPTQGETHAH